MAINGVNSSYTNAYTGPATAGDPTTGAKSTRAGLNGTINTPPPSGGASSRTSDTGSGVDFSKSFSRLASLARDPDALAAAMIELQQAQRQNAVDQRANAREAAKNQLLSSAEKTMDAAADQRQAAIASLVTGVVSGAISVGLSVLSAAQSVKGAKNAKEAGAAFDEVNANSGMSKSELSVARTKHLGDATSAQDSKIQLFNQISNAQSSFIGATGQGAAGNLQSDASRKEAESKTIQAEAQDTSTQQDLEKKFADELDQAIQQAIQFLKAMQDANLERMASVTKG